MCVGVNAHATVDETQLTRAVADLDCGRMRTPHFFGILLHGLLHSERGIAGPHRVVFMGEWRTEQRHDTVAHHLVDSALEAMHGVHHDVQGGVQEPPSLFRVKTLDQLRRAFDVGEEDRDLFALAFQSMAGCENLLGEIPGRIGLGSAKGL